ncbi:sensor histidine kinase [Cytophagaceae bacterium YF14B1]|uniref:Sensor histidine kinase n=1 Tax=Xanthocytophaga flava TaxID=3048013 RepID=A0AAE3QHX2_9BACT|nr:sensor histidine kinase [Xanthocytophaga flavus]MDJ1479682.1 sensor histidine kinase [Xanthocytophaga flavus]
MMRIIVCIGLIIGAFSVLAGQVVNQPADSLRKQLLVAREDTNKVLLYIALGQQYEDSKVDSAIHFFRKAGELSEKIKFVKGTLKYLANYTNVLNRQGKYTESLRLNQKAVAIAQKNNLKLETAKAYANLAANYQYQDEIDKSLNYYLKASSIFEDLKFDTGLYVMYANLCALYGNKLEQYENALLYADKAIVLARKQNNKLGIASVQINRSTVLNKQRKFDEALKALEEGYTIGKEQKNLYLQLVSLSIIGEMHLKQRKYAKVIPVAEEMLKLAKAMGDVEGQSLALGGLASAYLHAKEYTKAKQYAEKSLELSRNNNMRDIWKKKAWLLADIELALGNMKAYEDLSIEADSLDEVVLNEKMRKNMQELEAKYEATKKEDRIKELQKEKEIQVLNIRQKNILNYVFIGAIIILLVLGFLFYRNTRTQKIISQQTEKLQEQRIRELEQAQQLLAVNSMLQGQEAERSRLAKDLHDGLGGMLSSIKLSLSDMKGDMILSEQNASSFSRAVDQLDDTIRELRRVAHSMMPEALVRFGLVRALQGFCNDLGRSAHLSIDLQTIGLEDRLDSSTEIIVYRIVQELLNNIIKHAGATEVLVQIARAENNLNLTVEDNGKGFDTSGSYQGIGLSNIRSRVEYLNGNLEIQSSPGTGTSVNIDFTLKS